MRIYAHFGDTVFGPELTGKWTQCPAIGDQILIDGRFHVVSERVFRGGEDAVDLYFNPDRLSKKTQAMFEYIGEQIRTQVFARLTWISRAGGYTELLEVNDGGTQKRFPGAKPQYQVPCEPGDYLNMGPDGKETCIAFVDSPGLIQVDGRHSRYERVSAPFRVVVWYDDRKVRYDGPADKAGQMAKEITAYARAATLGTTGVSGCKVTYDSIDFDPARIWGAYGFKPDDALFMLPYRTFAISFRLRAFVVPGCADYSIQVQAVC